MSTSAGLQCLRPHLFKDIPVARKLVYTRFYYTTRRLAAQAGPSENNTGHVRNSSSDQFPAASPQGKQSPGHENIAAGIRGLSLVEQRVEELKAANALVYPRIQRTSRALSCVEYTRRYANLKAGEQLNETVTIRGILETIQPGITC
jgi:hypothetical protein